LLERKKKKQLYISTWGIIKRLIEKKLPLKKELKKYKQFFGVKAVQSLNNLRS